MVSVELAPLLPEPFGVRVAGGAVPWIPRELVLVKETVPVKPLTPFRLMPVDESVLPFETVTLD
jgi:hypothetical protein